MLRRRSGILAVPSPYADEEILLVARQDANLRPIRRHEWAAELVETGKTMKLRLTDESECRVLSHLLEACLAVAFEQADGYWRLSNSTRQWYRDRAAFTSNDIEAVPRVGFAVQVMGAGGLGVSFDTGYLYRTEWTLEDFFDEGVPAAERRERLRRFDRLRSRAQGRKGTLLYDRREGDVNICYYDSYREGSTCGTVGPVMNHSSLIDYYRATYPDLDVSPTDLAVLVSFPGPTIRHPVPVAAKLLRLRVMRDAEQFGRGQVEHSTLPPQKRKQEAEKAWAVCRGIVHDRLGLSFDDSFWQPNGVEHELLDCPKLRFGQERVLAPPRRATTRDYRHYYRQRLELLSNGGLYRLDPSIERRVFVVAPNDDSRWPDALQSALLEDLSKTLEGFAGEPFKLVSIRENEPDRIIERVQAAGGENAIIVFDDHMPAAYYLLAHGLNGWKIKRLTTGKVSAKWRNRQRPPSHGARRKAERRWHDMITHSTLDALDEMDAIPWRIESFGYEGCLAIDVGEGRRYFGMSLLICRGDERRPSFLRITRTWPKGDHQHEAINPEILRDKIVELAATYPGQDFVPLDSLLLLRDGRQCGEERGGIDQAIARLRAMKRLSKSAVVDMADVHKRSVKRLRMWENAEGRIRNVLEGQAIYLPDGATALICCTGRATVGDDATPEPCMIVARDGADIRRISRAVFALSQFNYTSPAKANRLALPLRESDQRLQQRVAEDTRGVK